MSTSASSLSAGVQQLYDQGLLPSSLSSSVLNSASSGQLNQLVNSAIASEENAALFGTGGDTATLSSTASTALLQEINPSSSSSSTTTDPLTQAVNNALTSNLDAAVSKFLPSSSTSSGQINVLA